LLKLPLAQLENALTRTGALKAPLIAHASQPNIRSSLPRSVLVVLGIAPDSETSSQAQTTGVAPDSQNSSQAQTSEAHTGHTSNSDNVVTEKSKESSGAT